MSSALPPTDARIIADPGATFMGRPSDALGERLLVSGVGQPHRQVDRAAPFHMGVDEVAVARTAGKLQ